MKNRKIVVLILMAAACAAGCRLLPTRLETVLPPDPKELGFFGSSVALNDTLFVVGSRGFPDGSGSGGVGTAYAFRLAGTWQMEKRFAPAGLQRGDWLGADSGAGGNSAVLGAPMIGPGGDNSGAAYFYDYAETVVRLTTGIFRGRAWVLSSTQYPPAELGPESHFGSAAAADGDEAVIGASRAWDPGDPVRYQNKGALVFYHRDPPPAENTAPIWSAALTKTFYDFNNQAEVGYDVSLRGDIAVAGAPGYSPETNGNEGAAIVFQRIGGQWTQTQILMAPEAPQGAVFGTAVSTDGSLIAVGAPYAPKSPSQPGTGAVYLFQRGTETNSSGGNVWTHIQAFYPSYDQELHAFGSQVAIDGWRIVTLEQNAPVIFHKDYGSWSRDMFSLPGPVKPLPSPRHMIALRWPNLLIASPETDVGDVGKAGVIYYATNWQLLP